MANAHLPSGVRLFVALWAAVAGGGLGLGVGAAIVLRQAAAAAPSPSSGAGEPRSARTMLLKGFDLLTRPAAWVVVAAAMFALIFIGANLEAKDYPMVVLVCMAPVAAGALALGCARAGVPRGWRIAIAAIAAAASLGGLLFGCWIEARQHEALREVLCAPPWMGLFFGSAAAALAALVGLVVRAISRQPKPDSSLR